MDASTDSLLGDSLDFSDVVVNEQPATLELAPLPFQATGDQCRSVQKAKSGFVARYVNGGRFSAKFCPNTANCVQIIECPTVATKCFELQSCESPNGNCRKFAPCPCNATANYQYKLAASPSGGIRFINGSKYLRQDCPSNGCFNLIQCPLSTNGAATANCFDLQSCEGSACYKLLACVSFVLFVLFICFYLFQVVCLFVCFRLFVYLVFGFLSFCCFLRDFAFCDTIFLSKRETACVCVYLLKKMGSDVCVCVYVNVSELECRAWVNFQWILTFLKILSLLFL